MLLTLSVLAILLSVIGAGMPLYPVFFTRIGIIPVYRARLLRLMTEGAAIVLILTTYALSPSWQTAAALVAVFVFVTLAVILEPQRFLIALNDPPHRAAHEATLGAQSIVFGTEVNGTACAWSFESLLPRHLINDMVDRIPVLVSYCAACRSVMIYQAQVDGRRLTFEVAGVWRTNMLMRDRETGTLWQQVTGEALIGPLKGKQLSSLGVLQTTWTAWREEHPDTWLAIEPATDKPGPFSHRFLSKWLIAVPRVLTLSGLHGLDRRLPAHTEVVGIRVNGEGRAYPFTAFQSSHLIHDHLGGLPVAVYYDSNRDEVRAFKREVKAHSIILLREGIGFSDTKRTMSWTLKGQPLRGTSEGLSEIITEREWWHAWSEFNPDTTVYGK